MKRLLVVFVLFFALEAVSNAPLTPMGNPLGRQSSAGGLSSGAADTTYLRLDATNGPLTGDLDTQGAFTSLGTGAFSGGGIYARDRAASSTEFVEMGVSMGSTDNTGYILMEAYGASYGTGNGYCLPTNQADSNAELVLRGSDTNGVAICSAEDNPLRLGVAQTTAGMTTLLTIDDDAPQVTSNATSWSFPSATTVTLADVTNAINFDSNTLTIDASFETVGILTAAPNSNVGLEVAQKTGANAWVLVENDSGSNHAIVQATSTSGTTPTSYLIAQHSLVGDLLLVASGTGSNSASPFTDPGIAGAVGMMSRPVNGSGATPARLLIAALGTATPIVLSTDSTERVRINTTEVVVNDLGNATTDFRVETDTQTSGLFIDASANTANFGVPLGVNTTTAPAEDLYVAPAAGDASVGVVSTLNTNAYLYVMGDGLATQFVQILSGTLGEAEILFQPSNGQNARIVHGGNISTDIEIVPATGRSILLKGAVTASGTLTFDGVTTDITAVSGQDVVMATSGAASVTLRSGDNNIKLHDSSSNVESTITMESGVTEGTCVKGANASAGVLCVEGQASVAGAKSNRGAGDAAFSIADTYTSASSRTILWMLLGSGVERPINQAALSITSPTDTTTSPLGGGSACRMSSTGAAAWTPSEGSALDGMYLCCTNTSTNAITMTDSAGVYEGSGSVVGQWDQVCMEYVTDRWVERSFKDN